MAKKNMGEKWMKRHRKTFVSIFVVKTTERITTVAKTAASVDIKDKVTVNTT